MKIAVLVLIWTLPMLFLANGYPEGLLMLVLAATISMAVHDQNTRNKRRADMPRSGKRKW